MKANSHDSPSQITKEEAVKQILELADELGRPPKKSELPEEIRCRIKPLFDKWCYALEEVGLKVPSEKVMEKRRKREAHRAAVAARKEKREAKARQKKLEQAKNDASR